MLYFSAQQLSQARSYVACTKVISKELFCVQNLGPHRSCHTSAPILPHMVIPAVSSSSLPRLTDQAPPSPLLFPFFSSATYHVFTNSSLRCFIFLSCLHIFGSSGGNTRSGGCRAACVQLGVPACTCCSRSRAMPRTAEEGSATLSSSPSAHSLRTLCSTQSPAFCDPCRS